MGVYEFERWSLAAPPAGFEPAHTAPEGLLYIALTSANIVSLGPPGRVWGTASAEGSPGAPNSGDTGERRGDLARAELRFVQPESPIRTATRCRSSCGGRRGARSVNWGRRCDLNSRRPGPQPGAPAHKPPAHVRMRWSATSDGPGRPRLAASGGGLPLPFCSQNRAAGRRTG